MESLPLHLRPHWADVTCTLFFSRPALINQNDGSLWAVFISRATAMTACRALRVFISLKWLHGAAIETSTLKVGTRRRTTGAECSFWVFKPTSGFMAEILLSLPKMLSFFLDISWDPEVVTRHRLHSLLEKYLDTRWRNVVAAAAPNVHLLKDSCFHTDIRNGGVDIEGRNFKIAHILGLQAAWMEL